MDLEEEINTIGNTDRFGIEVEGMNIWPLLRIHRLLLFKTGYSTPKNKSVYNEISFKDRILSTLGLLDKGLDKLPYDVWLVTDPSYFVKLEDGRVYDRILDPIAEILDSKNVNYGKVDIHANADFYSKNVAVHKVHLLRDNQFYYSQIPKRKSRYREFLKFFSELPEVEKLELNPNNLAIDLIRIIEQRDYFRKQLVRSRPTVIFTVCYYAIKKLGLIIAARELGIPVVDVQHGKQGKFHHMYNHWDYFPEGGYKMLPDFYWTWGPVFSSWIRESSVDSPFAPKVIEGGNPWVPRALMLFHDEWMSGYIQEQKKKFKTIALVALQPVKNPEYDQNLQLLIEQYQDVLFLLREHPVTPYSGSEKLLRYANVRHDDRFDQVNLYQVMKEVDMVVTGWSTVALESITLNTPVLIFHSIGRSTFAEWIDTGAMLSWDGSIDRKKLEDWIEGRGKAGKSETPMLIDSETSDRAIDTLLRLSSEQLS